MYNQRDYPGIPYPAKGYERATVKSSGCGPVSMSMVVENLTGKAFPPEESVALALQCGARVPGGTDMAALCKAACARFGLTWSTGNDIGVVAGAVGGRLWGGMESDGNASTARTLLTPRSESGPSEGCLASQAVRSAMAIANVGGDRKGYTGLFSSGGHYVVIAGVAGDGLLCVLDPNLYPGKFDIAGRRGRVARMAGDLVFVKPEELARDTQACRTRYYILKERVQ